MKRVRGGFGIVGLFVVLLLAVAFLPAIRGAFARSFPEGFQGCAAPAGAKKEGFRNVDCKGVTCAEGEFCQESVCRPIAAPSSGSYTGYYS